MEEVGKAWVLICCVIRSANLADRLNLLFSMSETGLPAPDISQLTWRQHSRTEEVRKYATTHVADKSVIK